MPYANYDGFGESYFEMDSVDEPNQAGYTSYTRKGLPLPARMVKYRDDLSDRSLPSLSILVAGCAYGYTVEELVEVGIDAYGMDVSSYAVGKASSETSVGDRVFQGDATSSSDISDAETAAGVGSFDVIYTEAMLTCLTDAEAQTACSNLRSAASVVVAHRVWAADGSDVNPEYYNTKTVSEWKSLCDPNEEDLWYTEYEFAIDRGKR